MINYTDHFAGSIGCASDDIREELEEMEIEDSVMMLVSEMPESEQGDDTMCLEEEETVEVRFVVKTVINLPVFNKYTGALICLCLKQNTLGH